VPTKRGRIGLPPFGVLCHRSRKRNRGVWGLIRRGNGTLHSVARVTLSRAIAVEGTMSMANESTARAFRGATYILKAFIATCDRRGLEVPLL